MARVGHRSHIVAGAAIALALLTVLAPVVPAGARGDHTRTRVIAPGVTLTTLTNIRIPQRAFVLTLDPSQGASLDIALAGGALARERTTSFMVESTGALAGINGDFTDLRSGYPVHPMVDQGELVLTSSRNLGQSFVLGTDGSTELRHAVASRSPPPKPIPARRGSSTAGTTANRTWVRSPRSPTGRRRRTPFPRGLHRKAHPDGSVP